MSPIPRKSPFKIDLIDLGINVSRVEYKIIAETITNKIVISNVK